MQQTQHTLPRNLSLCLRLALCALFCLWTFTLSSTPTRAAMPDEEFVELCEKGTTEQVQQALKEGANPNARHGRDETPLMRAATRKDPGLVQALLQAGADVNARDDRGMTALMSARTVAVVQALLAAGADPNVQDKANGMTALIYTADDAEIVAALLAAGADVNARNSFGQTALKYAKEKTVGMLVAAGADVNARDNYGKTALMWAANYANVGGVRALLAAGADKSLKDKEGHDALWHARHPESEFDNALEGGNYPAVIRMLGGGKNRAEKRR